MMNDRGSMDDRLLHAVEARHGRSLSEARGRRIRSMKGGNLLFGESVGSKEDLANWTPPTHAKSEEVTQALRSNMASLHAFSEMQAEHFEKVLGTMERKELSVGASIDVSDIFLVVESGALELIRMGETIRQLGPWDHYGELTLLRNFPRRIRVRGCEGPTVLWCLPRAMFTRTLAHLRAKEFQTVRETLGSVQLLDGLTDRDLNMLARAVHTAEFKAGTRIITRGEIGNEMYIIQRGEVVCEIKTTSPSSSSVPPSPPSTPSTGKAAQVINVNLKEGEHFGERALLFNDTRAADVNAVTDTLCFVIDRVTFEKVLGNRSDILARMDDHVKLQVVDSIKAFESLSKELKKELVKAMSVRQYQHHDVIVPAGSPAEALFVMKSGGALCCEAESVNSGGGGGLQSITVSSGSSIDHHSVLEVMEKGSIFGEEALSAQGGVNSHTIVANGRSIEAFAIDRESILRCLSSQPPPAPSVSTDGEDEAAILRASQREEAKLSLVVSNIQELDVDRTLGMGSFGRVKLATHKDSSKVLALKIMQKSLVVMNRQIRQISRERAILKQLSHPNVLRLYGTFQDQDHVYMLLELIPGGELFRRVHGDGSEENQLTFEECRFYAAQVLNVYEHIHALNIIYRDLKPENLLISETGYLKVVDWGLAKVQEDDMTFTRCGTTEYMAPEMDGTRWYGKSVDYWSLGVLLYELLVGYGPFVGDDINDTAAIEMRARSGVFEWPEDRPVDDRMKSLVKQFLTLDPLERLGNTPEGIEAAHAHPVFEGFDFKSMREFQMEAPWVPVVENEKDVSNFDDIYDDEDEEFIPYDGNDEFEF